MNRENLQKMADYIRTIRQEKFDMYNFRKDNYLSHRCLSVGCVIGHCTILDKWKNIPKIIGKRIDYQKWSERFTNLILDNGFVGEWKWCFDGAWHFVDDTPQGAALRIEWLLNNGLPENWKEQMQGEAELCYLPKNSTTNE